MNPEIVGDYHNVKIYHYKGASASGPGSTEVVFAHVPQDGIKLTLGSKWAQNSVGAAIEAGMNKFNETLGAVTGYQLRSPITSALAYQGTDPAPEISLTLEFHAEASAKEDVMVPIGKLISMCVPELRSNLQVSIPGPKASDAILGLFTGQSQPQSVETEKISLFIGTSFAFENVVITSISINMGTNVALDGYPIYANATIVCKPFMTPYRSNIKDMLRLN